MVVHHRDIILLRADVKDVAVLSHESDPRRTALRSLVLELGVKAQLVLPVMLRESADGGIDVYRRKISRREIGSLNPIWKNVHSLDRLTSRCTGVVSTWWMTSETEPLTRW